MRKVTSEITSAFLNGKPARRGNTSTDGVRLLLHGNPVAEWRGGRLYVTFAGWVTSTTRERLSAFARASISKGQGFINGKPVKPDEWVRVARPA